MGNGTDTLDVPLLRDETQVEYTLDFVLGIAFFIIGVIAAQR
jgi:hypothetical protein